MDLINTPIALLAGMLTIASPCVLPLLPVLLGTSLERSGRLRPLFVVSGFVLAFAGLGIALSLISNLNEHVHEAVRSTSIVLLALFGLARIWPGPYDRLIARIGPARASTVTYLVPMFGALFAWLFLGEPVTGAMVIAGVLILGSVAASQR